MDGYHNPQRSPRTHNYNVGTAGLCEIEALATTFVFLCYLGIDLDAIDDTVATTPELPFSTLRHDRVVGTYEDGPWNANRVGNAPDVIDKVCQSQWHLYWQFVRKINGYRLALQGYDDLRLWIGPDKRSKDIIYDGLRALGGISQGIVPDQLKDILWAMVVQHATHDFTQKRYLFKVNESAFTAWRGMIPWITEADQNILDLVFKRLTSLDGSSPGDAPSSRLSSQPLSGASFSGVTGVGSKFTTHTVHYPMAVDGNSLHDPPQHGPNTISPSSTSFNHPAEGYPSTPYMNHTQALGNYMWDASLFGAYQQAPGSSGPYLLGDPNPYPSIQHQPQQTGFGSMYGPSQRSNYNQYETRINPGALKDSNPFVVFMEFMNGFTTRGVLPRLFSHNLNLGSSTRPDLNLQDYKLRFLTEAGTSFFDPLRRSLFRSPPVAQAIVSTAWSLIQSDKLHSFQDTADYMVHLSKQLLPSRNSCAEFARVVLETCSSASAAYGYAGILTGQILWDQNRSIDRRVDEIAREWRGSYQPTCLLRGQNLNSSDSRNLRPNTSSRASSNQLTLSNIDSSGSVRPGYPYTEVSTAHTTNTTPSLSSTVHCPSCDRSFSGKHAKSHLSRHKRDHREADSHLHCPFCDKVFNHTRTDNIRTHCRNVHQQELPKDGRKYWAKKPTPSEP